MNFRNIMEKCAEIDDRANVYFNGTDELVNLWCENPDLRLITPLRLKDDQEQASIFEFSDCKQQDLRNDFLKKLYLRPNQNICLDWKKQLHYFLQTRVVFSTKNWASSEAVQTLLILSSLYDEFEVEADNHEDLLLVELFGPTTEHLFGFRTLKGCHLLHYITLLGSIVNQSSGGKKNTKALITAAQQTNILELLGSDEYAFITKAYVEMEIAYWKYHIGLRKTSENVNLSVTPFLSHAAAYDPTNSPFLKLKEFLESCYKKVLEAKKTLTNLSVSSELPRLMSIMELMMKHLTQKEQELITRKQLGEQQPNATANPQMNAPDDQMMQFDV